MGHFFITFRSVTFAQRGERALSAVGIRCSLRRTPRWMEEQGCGYALKLATRDIAPAVEVLRKNQVPLRRIYQQRAEGVMEEVEV